jgi:polyisoprenoid-binding protein YceI
MASMMKITLALLIAAAAVGGWAWYSSSQNARGPIGQPELSATPTGSVAAVSAVLTDGIYSLVASASGMTWQGSKSFVQGYFDNGSISISSGSTSVVGGVVASGSVVVDMTSILATSTGRGVGMDMLSKHLKSSDFFDAEKYPQSTFALSKLTRQSDGAYLVEGTLTIKGITQPVSFTASVVQSGDLLTMTAKNIVLDRTLWQVKYGSGKFFKELVGDKLVADTFSVSFTAVGKRK